MCAVNVELTRTSTSPHFTGNPVESFGLSVEDIQTDFDPETYDETMKKVFSEDYYEEEGEEEETKPVFSDLEGEDEGEEREGRRRMSVFWGGQHS